MKYKNIVEEFSKETVGMIMLAELTEDFICEVEEMHPEMVEKFLMKLKMYSYPFKNRDRAEYATSKLQNEDGTVGAHWEYETTSKVAEKYGIDDNPVFYYVLNMIYSDYYESGKSDETYIKDAVKFIKDKDAPTSKVERYYRAMNY